MVRHLQRARLALCARRARRGDDGIALVAAIGVAVVALMLATTVVAVTVRSATATGRGRDRDQAYAAAEAGVDAATAVLAGPAAQWPSLCPVPPTTATAAVALTTASDYQTALLFGTALDGAGGVTGSVACGSSAAVYARVTSTGTARVGGGVRQVQVLKAVVKLPRPRVQSAVAANDIAYSGAYIKVLGGSSEHPAVSVGAETTDWTCGQYDEFTGDVIVPGARLVLDFYCKVHGSVRAQQLQMNAYSQVDGGVVTQSAVQRGSFTTIGGTVTYQPDASAWGPVPVPPATYDAAAWAARGFTERSWGRGCTLPTGTVSLTEYTGPTVVDTRTTCPGGLANINAYGTLALNSDLVLVVNGVSTAPYFTITSTSTTPHKLWIIRPATSTTACSDKENTSFGEYSVVSSTVSAYVSSGCHVSLHAYTSWRGQISTNVLWWYAYAQVLYLDDTGAAATAPLSVVSQSS